jgi:hypothetical protein
MNTKSLARVFSQFAYTSYIGIFYERRSAATP